MTDKILIVDDDEELRGELRGLLNDYETIEASCGRAALDLLDRANEIGLVMLDVMMPGINGLDVLAEIKRSSPEVRTVILTGHSSKDIAIEALKAHADDYIEKPVCAEKIRDVVDKLMSRGSSENGGVLDPKAKIEKVKQFVQRNCFKKTGLADAARAIWLSPKYLSRIFKEETGMGFSEYRLRIKIAKSKELLSRTALNINQISDKLGYENTESFIKRFKRFAKVTPTAYRKKILKKKAMKPVGSAAAKGKNKRKR